MGVRPAQKIFWTRIFLKYRQKYFWVPNSILTVKNMGHLPLMKRHFIESSYSHYGACVFRRFWTKHQGRAEKTMPLWLNCFLSIDVVWHQPWPWNDSACVFTKTLFLFLGHVKSHSFPTCTMWFRTLHLGRAKKLLWQNRVKRLAMRHQIGCFVHFLVAFHFGCMNVFGVCSTFFDACCSEVQNNET